MTGPSIIQEWAVTALPAVAMQIRTFPYPAQLLKPIAQGRWAGASGKQKYIGAILIGIYFQESSRHPRQLTGDDQRGHPIRVELL